MLVVLAGIPAEAPAIIAVESKCLDKDAMLEEADYVVEANVERLEPRWDSAKGSISSYLSLKVSSYIKGEPLPNDQVQIILAGGCLGEICESVEDQPDPKSFVPGQKIKVYLQKAKEGFVLLCGFLGVEGNTIENQ